MEFKKSLLFTDYAHDVRDDWHFNSLTRVYVTNGTGFKSVLGDV